MVTCELSINDHLNIRQGEDEMPHVVRIDFENHEDPICEYIFG